MGKELIIIKMERNVMMENGKMENGMDKELIIMKMERYIMMENGKMEIKLISKIYNLFFLKKIEFF